MKKRIGFIVLFILLLISGYLLGRMYPDASNENEDESTILMYYDKYELLFDYTDRVRLANMSLIKLMTYNPSDAQFYLEGYLTRNNDVFYFKSEPIVRKIYSKNEAEINELLDTNDKLQTLIFSIHNMLYKQKENKDFNKKWSTITPAFKSLADKLISGSSSDLNLSNLTSDPDTYFNNPKARNFIKSLNDEIDSLQERVNKLTES